MKRNYVGLRVRMRNCDSAVLDYVFEDYIDFLRACNDEDNPYSWDNEILLAVLGHSVVYTSLGKKKPINLLKLYKWLSATASADGYEEEYQPAVSRYFPHKEDSPRG